MSGGRPSFYSHENAPGIIMAVGNTGAYLDLEADQLCTWLSRDGGLSWEDVRETAHIYDFGDHGGILVSAKHGTQVAPLMQPLATALWLRELSWGRTLATLEPAEACC